MSDTKSDIELAKEKAGHVVRIRHRAGSLDVLASAHAAADLCGYCNATPARRAFIRAYKRARKEALGL
jgi:hypothetical protein